MLMKKHLISLNLIVLRLSSIVLF